MGRRIAVFGTGYLAWRSHSPGEPLPYFAAHCSWKCTSQGVRNRLPRQCKTARA
jgi:hypothetical protein